MDGPDAGNIFLDDVVDASFLGNTSQVPMVHVTRPKIFDDTAASKGDSRNFDDRHFHFHLIVAKDFTEGVLLVSNMRRNLAFDDDFGVGRNEEFISPGRGWCHP